MPRVLSGRPTRGKGNQASQDRKQINRIALQLQKVAHPTKPIAENVEIIEYLCWLVECARLHGTFVEAVGRNDEVSNQWLDIIHIL